jgi:HAMP domain-containing protein
VDAATVVAIVAAVIAAAAALATFQQARSARQQTELQGQMRVDSAQPYVFVDFRIDRTQAALVSVHLENHGPTVATNVRLAWQPELPERHHTNDGFAALAPRRLPSMPPGRIMTWALGFGADLMSDSTVPKEYLVTVEADGPFGPVEPLTYTLSLGDMAHQMTIPAGSLHKVEQAITRAAEKLATRQQAISRSPS